MDAIRLLPAPVDSTSNTSEVQSRSTSLVQASQQALARAKQQDTAAYPSDRYIWTVSVADDGTFNFYAVPKTAYQNSSQADTSSSRSWQDSWAAWGTNSSNGLNAPSYAVQQYAYYASAAPGTGTYLNIYA